MSKLRRAILCGPLLLIGILIGAYLFKDTRPRAFLQIPNCTTSCFNKSELIGLLTSVGIQKIPAVIPIVKETDRVIAIKSPQPLARINYIILPKKDIRDLGDLSSSDREYIDETFLVISELIRENNLTDYRVLSNGPGLQITNYLHFHLLAE